MRDGPLLIGMGMASAAYPANRSPASASAKTGMMYACPNGTFSRTLAKVALGTPTTMRAPGELPGFSLRWLEINT